MHTFTYGMPPKGLPTSTNHQNAYQLQIRLPAYHMLTCLPAYHISRGHKRLPAYLLTTCPVAPDHSNAEISFENEIGRNGFVEISEVLCEKRFSRFAESWPTHA